MKLWEKVNNITGNESKAKFLVEFINAGSKFIVSSLPERFLWSIASETEIYGRKAIDSVDTNVIGNGSEVAYDKILAVYRFDGTKRRVANEIPDKNIHATDESDSLSFPTKMFPAYYKLSGKIYIKPDPDFNNTSSNLEYTKVGESSTTTIAQNNGDKGVIVYSAPPIIDENTENWVLTEFENVSLLYAASLDMLRLANIKDAEKIFEGGYSSTDTNTKTSLSAIHWLEDEDAEMAMATIQAADGNMRLANDRIQKAINFYQRAVSELQSITGAIVAPEEQQRSQRRPQGRTS
jgi:hypothetical protein